MSDRDYLCYLIYMFADYMFSDATLINGRVDIYNESSEVVLSIYVNSSTPDSTVFSKTNVKGTVEAVTVMKVFINFLRMIHDRHEHPFDAINRLVSVSK